MGCQGLSESWTPKNSSLSERFGKVQVGGGVPEGKGEQWQHLSRGWMLPGTLATCVGGNRRHPRPTWQAKASRAAKASDLREENWNVFFFCSLISDRVPSSLVRMGVSRLKAGSFLKMPSLHLL